MRVIATLDGAVKKYVDGKLAMETTYVDGKVEGPYTELRHGPRRLLPLRPLVARPTQAGLATRLAVAYPTARRFRTGATLAMYCIVVLVIVAGSGFVAMIGGFMKSSDAYAGSTDLAQRDESPFDEPVIQLPVVDAPRTLLLETDIMPFRAAIAAGVASIMTAHVAYPALDASRAPATLSTKILHFLLREKLRFDGLIVTDALIMEGVLGPEGEAAAAVRAIDACVDRKSSQSVKVLIAPTSSR